MGQTVTPRPFEHVAYLVTSIIDANRETIYVGFFFPTDFLRRPWTRFLQLRHTITRFSYMGGDAENARHENAGMEKAGKENCGTPYVE